MTEAHTSLPSRPERLHVAIRVPPAVQAASALLGGVASCTSIASSGRAGRSVLHTGIKSGSPRGHPAPSACGSVLSICNCCWCCRWRVPVVPIHAGPISIGHRMRLRQMRLWLTICRRTAYVYILLFRRIGRCCARSRIGLRSRGCRRRRAVILCCCS